MVLLIRLDIFFALNRHDNLKRKMSDFNPIQPLFYDATNQYNNLLFFFI